MLRWPSSLRSRLTLWYTILLGVPLIVFAECALVVLYLIPQTSALAAIILTGYLGGAVAAHVRIGDTARAAIPVVVGILAWGSLYLRDSRIRQLIPFRRA